MASQARVHLKLLTHLAYLPQMVTATTKLGGRGKRLIPLKPVAGTLMVTHACNFRCTMCAFGRGIQPVGELTTEELLSVVRQFREVGAQYCTFTGGEPLLRKDLEQAVAEAKRIGFASIQVTSNGSLMTEARARSLLEAGLNHVSISVDGYGASHEKQRQVPGAWKKTTDALRRLAKLRDTEFPDLLIDIPITFSPINRRDVAKMFALCDELNASLSPQFLEHSAFFCNEHTDDQVDWDSDREGIDELMDELHRYVDHPRMSKTVMYHSLEYIRKYLKREPLTLDNAMPCVSGHQTVMVDAMGRIYSGCFAMPHTSNIREQRLADVLVGEAHRQNIDEMLQLNCPTCPDGMLYSLAFYLPTAMREMAFRASRRIGVNTQALPTI